MELLVATWTLRLVIVATLVVGGLSYSSGSSPLEAVDRAIAAAFVFTVAGRWLIGWLETPETKLMRARQRREARRAKAGGGKAATKAPAKAGKSETGAAKGKPAKSAKPAKNPKPDTAGAPQPAGSASAA